MEARAAAILDHIGRYTITLKIIIDELFFDTASSQNAINQLTDAGLIQAVKGALTGGYRYYQLTPKGANARNIPVNRARPKETKGLALDLAALWFSCMGEAPRKRLIDRELAQLFGALKGGNVVHVAENSDEDSAVFRVFVPGTAVSLKSFVSTLKKSAHDAMGDEKLLDWIERGTYRFVVLLHSEARRDEVRRQIRQQEFPNLRIHLEIGPSPMNLRDFIAPEREGME